MRSSLYIACSDSHKEVYEQTSYLADCRQNGQIIAFFFQKLRGKIIKILIHQLYDTVYSVAALLIEEVLS